MKSASKTVLCIGALLIAGNAQTKDAITIKSNIVSMDKAHKTHYDGSIFYTYFIGESIGTKNAISGVAVIEPNNEIHPPHAHLEEEFLYVVEGSGTWLLNGVNTPAKAGDLLYASPWDTHGIFNDGDIPMKFFIVKASSKGIKIPSSIKAAF